MLIIYSSNDVYVYVCDCDNDDGRAACCVGGDGDDDVGYHMHEFLHPLCYFHHHHQPIRRPVDHFDQWKPAFVLVVL